MHLMLSCRIPPASRREHTEQPILMRNRDHGVTMDVSDVFGPAAPWAVATVGVLAAFLVAAAFWQGRPNSGGIFGVIRSGAARRSWSMT